MANENPTGAGDASVLGIQERDRRQQWAVLSFVLEHHQWPSRCRS
jgi:hypothetical protein